MVLNFNWKRKNPANQRIILISAKFDRMQCDITFWKWVELGPGGLD